VQVAPTQSVTIGCLRRLRRCPKGDSTVVRQGILGVRPEAGLPSEDSARAEVPTTAMRPRWALDISAQLANHKRI